MEMNVRDEQKTVDIWLTNAENRCRYAVLIGART